MSVLRSSSATKSLNSTINALVHFNPSPTHATTGTLSDLVIAIKDTICTKDMPTTCSSAMLSNFRPPYDATVVRLLRSQGVRILGKANCDEFGMGSTNTNSVHGPVVNPFSVAEQRSAGGSSGGSAAAVAAGLCDAALGTDTGGSTRLPASYCGVVGFKPSYGLLSRHGVVSFADSLDCVGILGRDVHTTKRVFDTLNVYDTNDPTSALLSTRQAVSSARSSTLRIGIPQEYFPAELSPETLTPVRALLTKLKLDYGAVLVPVSLPSTTAALSAYYVLSSAEGSSCLARYDGVRFGSRVPVSEVIDTADVYAHTRSAKFGKEVKKRILLGTYALAADKFSNYFLQAQRIRNAVREDFDNVFSAPNVLRSSSQERERGQGVDVIMHPSAIGIAPLLQPTKNENGLDGYVQDVLTVPASLAGLPALSVPLNNNNGQGAGWPVGLSVIGQWGSDSFVLEVGKMVQRCVSETKDQ